MEPNKKFWLHLLKNWPAISYVVLLILAFAYFTYLQAAPALPDPDSFYHVKMSLLLPQQGILQQFPWLQVSILKDSYTDQHLLYHIFLMPFTHLMSPLWGAKLATVILNVGLAVLVYWFLRTFKVKFAFIFTLIMLVSTPLIFRINLVKAPTFSLIFLLAGLYCLFRYRYLLAFLLSFLYVWAYGGFILIIVFAGLYALVNLTYDCFEKRSIRRLWLMIRHSRAVRLFFVTCAGVASGIVINPQFPRNIMFYWHQLVRIGIINYQKVIPVGNEWYPYKFADLTAGTAFLSILLLVAFFVFLATRKIPSRRVMTLGLIFAFLLAFTLKSRRYVEYYVPFTTLFAAFALDQPLQPFAWNRLWTSGLNFFRRYPVVVSVLLMYFCIMVPAIAIKDIRATAKDLQNGIPLSRFSGAAGWLVANSRPGEIVFHSSWDEFPQLFFYDSKNYYIAGLDPTFTYDYSQQLYQKMVDITIGQQTTHVYEDLANDFHASYVFVEKMHYAMANTMRADERFEEVYADSEATIYRIN